MADVEEVASHEHRLETPLGYVTVTVDGCAVISFEDSPVAIPALPEGMHVDGARLLRIRLEQSVTPDKPVVLIAVATTDGSADTGEWLESMVYESADGILHIGFRDSEWLANEGITAVWADYGPNYLQQRITAAPGGSSIFVSLAWRLAGKIGSEADASTWFAVDLLLPHQPTRGS